MVFGVLWVCMCTFVFTMYDLTMCETCFIGKTCLHIVTMVSLLFVLMFCIWGWEPEDCINVVDRFEIPSITLQCQTYIDKNKTGDASVPFRVRTNGNINVQMCNRMPYVLKRAAFIAQEYENDNKNTTYAATLILVVFWEIMSDMRFVFWVLWSTKIPKNNNNERPWLIVQMLNRGFRAIYIAYNLCSVMVSIYIYIRIHIYMYIYKCTYTFWFQYISMFINL